MSRRAPLAFGLLLVAGAVASSGAGAGSATRPRPPTEALPPRPALCGSCLTTLRFSLGNVSVPLLLQAWGNSPLLPPGSDVSPAAHAREVAAYLAQAAEGGASALEDYVGWGVVEPAKDEWQWDVYRRNQASIRGAGLGYTPYVWVHNLPAWARADPTFVHPRCLEHHQESESSLSVFSQSTADLYERVYSQLHANLGDELDLLRFATPNDFGEAGYPTGVASEPFPDRHIHVDFWVDEPEARADFVTAMTTRYGAIAQLNAAWGTQFAAFEDLDYPSDASQPRRWLDFIRWYHDARTERIGSLMDIARRHFPYTPISLNLGFPDERISYGQDPTGLTKMLAQKGFQPRVPNGFPVPYLVTRRVATAAHLYKPTGLATEPAQGYSGGSDTVRRDVADALFRDLTMGVTLHFDYANNLIDGQPAIAQALAAGGGYPATDTALFFSTTAHRLDTQRDSDGLYKGFPDGLVDIAEGLRDILDYDVLDERLVEDGFLDQYDVLIWPVGMLTEASTLHSLRAWIDRGGILIVGSLAAVHTVENDRGAFADLTPDPSGRTRVGNGSIYDLGGGAVDLGSLVASRAYVTADATPAAGLFLAPLDTTFDNVLVSQFAAGLLLYNRGSTTVSHALSVPPGPWRFTNPNLPPSVTLEPGAIRWIGH